MISFAQYVTEALTKVTCRRCGGSGSFAFNLKDGTKCYGCNGSGFQMRNVVVDTKNDASRTALKVARDAYHNAVRACSEATFTKWNQTLGTGYDINKELSWDLLSKAIYTKTGKNLYAHRDEELKKLGLKKP